MRRWDKGYYDGDDVAAVCAVLAVIAFIVILFVAAIRSGGEAKKPISYAMKNTVTYMVKAQCPNCKKSHKIETSVGVDVKADHQCPWCGLKKEFTIICDEGSGK